MTLRFGRATSLVAIDACVLVAERPAWGEVAAALSSPRSWLARQSVDQSLAALAGAALWLLAAWLGVALVCAALAQAPGAFGRAAAAVCRRVLPRLARDLLLGTTGVSILIAPTAALAAAPGLAAGHQLGPAHRSTAVTAPAGRTALPDTHASTPTAPPTATPTATRTGPAAGPSPVAAPGWPVDATPTPAGQPRLRPATTGAGRGAPAPDTDRRDRRPASAASPAVTVRPGDSLWLIAQRRLGDLVDPSRVAAQWPRWYAANRTVVGPDPNFLLPGEVLRAPARARAVSSTDDVRAHEDTEEAHP